MNNIKNSNNGVFVCVLAGLFSGLSGCGGGGGDSNDVSASTTATTPVTTPVADPNPAVNSDTTTLASCVGAAEGKSFTVDATRYEQTVPYPFTYSLYGGTFNGNVVTVKKRGNIANTTSYRETYGVYTPSRVTILADRLYAYDSVSKTYKTYTDAYSGYSIDLTKKVGESQNVDITTTDDASNSSVDHRVYTFEGVETLTIAGVTLNTCRLSVTSSSPYLNDYGSRHGTYKMTEWVSAGYGLDDYEPIKSLATITFLDGNRPSSVTESSLLTSPLK